MSSYKRGAENVPLQKINTSMPIMVYIRDLSKGDDEDDLVAEFKLDFANYEDRRHMGRLTFWAVSNGHMVETLSLKDALGEK